MRVTMPRRMQRPKQHVSCAHHFCKGQGAQRRNCEARVKDSLNMSRSLARWNEKSVQKPARITASEKGAKKKPHPHFDERRETLVPAEKSALKACQSPAAPQHHEPNGRGCLPKPTHPRHPGQGQQGQYAQLVLCFGQLKGHCVVVCDTISFCILDVFDPLPDEVQQGQQCGHCPWFSGVAVLICQGSPNHQAPYAQ